MAPVVAQQAAAARAATTQEGGAPAYAADLAPSQAVSGPKPWARSPISIAESSAAEAEAERRPVTRAAAASYRGNSLTYDPVLRETLALIKRCRGLFDLQSLLSQRAGVMDGIAASAALAKLVQVRLWPKAWPEWTV